MIQNNKLIKTYAWIVWILSASFLFFKYALEVSPSVMANNLMHEFHIQATQLGNLTAFYFYAYLIMQLPVGVLLDKFGARFLTSIAIFVCALGTLLLAHAESFYLACLGRFLTGIGASFAVISCLKLSTVWFPPRQFAFMAGLMMTAGMLGAVGGEGPLAASISAIGWRETLNTLAVIGIAFAVVYFVVVRDSRDKQVASKTHETTESFLVSLRKIIRSKQNWYLSVFSGLAFTPVAVIGGLWGVPFIIRSHHLTKTAAATDISLVFIGFAIGAPIFGYLSDLIGKRKPLIYFSVSLATVLISSIIFYTSISPILLSTLLLLFGFFISSFMISFGMIREINPLRLAATSVAFMNTLNALLCAFADPFVGKLLDIFWDGQYQNGVPVFKLHDYQAGLLSLPVFLLIALLLLTQVRETHCQQLEG